MTREEIIDSVNVIRDGVKEIKLMASLPLDAKLERKMMINKVSFIEIYNNTSKLFSMEIEKSHDGFLKAQHDYIKYLLNEYNIMYDYLLTMLKRKKSK